MRHSRLNWVVRVIFGLVLCACGSDPSDSKKNPSGTSLQSKNSSLKTGVYALKGTNGTDPYSGTVTISQDGENYALAWNIEGVQTQRGMGILQNGVMSVFFFDDSEKDFGGVISYVVVSPTQLEGKWSAFGSDFQGSESLVFQAK